jgi:hypothetical protein
VPLDAAAVWIKAHLTLEKALARGFPQEHWLGNHWADAALEAEVVAVWAQAPDRLLARMVATRPRCKEFMSGKVKK